MSVAPATLTARLLTDVLTATRMLTAIRDSDSEIIDSPPGQ